MSKDSNNIVAGIQAVISAIKSNPGGIARLHIAPGSKNQRVRDIELLATDNRVEIIQSHRAQLDELAGQERHQDVVAELYKQTELAESDLTAILDAASADPLLLVLDGVTDPHNLGACLRSAEATGVNAVIIPRDRSVGLTPVARRASAGASELVPVIRVTNLARTLRSLKERGIWLCGTSDQARQTLYQQDLKGPLALVMGSEGKGIRRLTAETCDFLVSIPMAGQIESLNVSVATGVSLFEISRQRGDRKK